MIKNFLRDETGLELSEYAVVGAFSTLGSTITTKIGELSTHISTGK
jgi:Flp pilus assembly pilin Flp